MDLRRQIWRQAGNVPQTSLPMSIKDMLVFRSFLGLPLATGAGVVAFMHALGAMPWFGTAMGGGAVMQANARYAGSGLMVGGGFLMAYGFLELVHLVLSIGLLYGVAMERRGFAAPWLLSAATLLGLRTLAGIGVSIFLCTIVTAPGLLLILFFVAWAALDAFGLFVVRSYRVQPLGSTAQNLCSVVQEE